MTTIVNELRPGRSWLLLIGAGVLLAGAALMLAVLPSNHRFANQASRSSSDVYWVRCPSPFIRALDDIGSRTGWFELSSDAPVISVVMGAGADAYCTISARRRLSLALVLGGVGAVTVVAGSRRAAAMTP